MYIYYMFLPLRQAIDEYNIPIWNQVHCYAATDIGKGTFGKKKKKAKIARQNGDILAMEEEGNIKTG